VDGAGSDPGAYLLSVSESEEGMTHDLQAIRNALADYIGSEGCSCCRNEEAHTEAKKRLAELLEVPLYSDGSGYNFGLFKSKP